MSAGGRISKTQRTTPLSLHQPELRFKTPLLKQGYKNKRQTNETTPSNPNFFTLSRSTVKGAVVPQAARGQCTCVLQHKTVAAEGGVAAEGEEELVGAALDTVGDVGAVETSQQGAQRVRTVINVEEVITRLQAEPENRAPQKALNIMYYKHGILMAGCTSNIGTAQ